MTGHYERRGVWCGQTASCQPTTTKPRQLKSSGSGKGRQADNGSNGYDQLPEQQGWIPTGQGFVWATLNWAALYSVARHFANKAMTDDRQDLLHDLIEGLARVAQRKIATGQDFTEPAMYRVAEHIKDHYWYSHYSYHNGVDCQHCSKAQRAKCRWNWGHSDWAYCDCHRAITLESINQPITDSEGNMTELAELIADDNALDLTAWTDARTFLIGAPIRLKQIALNVSKGKTLTNAELCYLSRLRRKTQKTLV